MQSKNSPVALFKQQFPKIRSKVKQEKKTFKEEQQIDFFVLNGTQGFEWKHEGHLFNFNIFFYFNLKSEKLQKGLVEESLIPSKTC